MDPIWNKIYHALGAPDAQGLGRMFDPEDVGAVGRERFTEILRVRFPPAPAPMRPPPLGQQGALPEGRLGSGPWAHIHGGRGSRRHFTC